MLIEIFLALLIAYSIYNYLLKLKTNRILQEQNERINNTNKKLTLSEQNLKLINATKDKFFSIISHDLKNPFTSLLSISETMKENYDSFEEEEKKNSVQRIHGSIKNIYNLLENLLTWSRTQTGRIQFNPEKFNLSNLLEENCSLFAHTASKKDIKLISNYQDGLIVNGDRNMINAVVRNLLNNGLKFTATGKSVEVGTNDHPEEVEVYIKDQGVGISEEDQQKLFRIDKKVKTTGTAGEKGTGLGLIICKEFIEKNSGRIKVNSRPGEGSTFSFTIPKQ
jgi:signal transduction histidine kinase